LQGPHTTMVMRTPRDEVEYEFNLFVCSIYPYYARRPYKLSLNANLRIINVALHS
jgi:hypothetical protein